MTHSIETIRPRMIYDSRSLPTLEVDVTAGPRGVLGRASSPSGVAEHQTGNGPVKPVKPDFDRIQRAKESVDILATSLRGVDVMDQASIDRVLREFLSVPPYRDQQWQRFTWSVSLAAARAAASIREMEFFSYVAQLAGTDGVAPTMPVPMMNVINGGAVGDKSLAFKAFMIVPVRSNSFVDSVRMGTEVFHRIGRDFERQRIPFAIGEEGGFAPQMRRMPEIEKCVLLLNAIVDAIKSAGYTPGQDVSIALDGSVSRYFDTRTGTYALNEDEGALSTQDLVSLFADLVSKYPIVALEDPLASVDDAGFVQLQQRLNDRIMLVGDEIYGSAVSLLSQRSATKPLTRGFLLKPDCVGTVTEAIASVASARQLGFEPIISHRSGETEDTSICDLCVGTRARVIKAGGIARGERTEKYNRLIRIEESLKSQFGAGPHVAFGSAAELATSAPAA